MFDFSLSFSRTTKTALMVIAIIWVVSMCLLTPRINVYGIYTTFHIVSFTDLCDRVISEYDKKVDTISMFIFLYLLPQIVMALSHFGIGRRLWHSQRPGDGLACNQGTILGIRERRRIAKILIVITIVFGIGWLPIHLYHLVEDFDYGNILFGETIDSGTVSLFFSFGANSLNPLFYCIFSSTFRKHFKQELLCRKRGIFSTVGRVDVRRPIDGVMLPTLPPRPPALLLPRPASIIFNDEVKPVLELPNTNSQQREPLLGNVNNQKTRKVIIYSRDATPVISPLSIEELTGIQVEDMDQSSMSDGISGGLSSTHKPCLSSLYLKPFGVSNDAAFNDNRTFNSSARIKCLDRASILNTTTSNCKTTPSRRPHILESTVLSKNLTELIQDEELIRQYDKATINSAKGDCEQQVNTENIPINTRQCTKQKVYKMVPRLKQLTFEIPCAVVNKSNSSVEFIDLDMCEKHFFLQKGNKDIVKNTSASLKSSKFSKDKANLEINSTNLHSVSERTRTIVMNSPLTQQAFAATPGSSDSPSTPTSSFFVSSFHPSTTISKDLLTKCEDVSLITSSERSSTSLESRSCNCIHGHKSMMTSQVRSCSTDLQSSDRQHSIQGIRRQDTLSPVTEVPGIMRTNSVASQMPQVD